MDSNKVYKDIVYLLYNILDNEKLKYELYKDENYRELCIELIDDLFTLEKNDEAKFDDDVWAKAFGKALVIISQAKQRFEVKEKKSVEDIYADYSKMIAQSVKAFEVARDSLTNEKIKFTKADVLYNGRLSEDTIKQYDDLAKQDMEAKAQADKEKTFINDEENKAKPDDQQANNNQNYGPGFGGGFGGFNPFGQGPNGQQFGAENMPQNPMQDPRYYPYTRKPKFMPWFKIAVGVITIIAAILLICANSFAISKSINWATSIQHTNLAGILINPKLTINGTKIDATKIKTIGDFVNNYFNGNLAINAQSKNEAMNIISYIFYVIAAVYVGFACFRKPRNLADKYRISYWPIIFMVVFFGLSIIDTYQYASLSEIRSPWENYVSQMAADGSNWHDAFNNWFNKFKAEDKLTSVTVLMDVALAFLALACVSGIAICFFNPKIDRAKYQKAMNEYQRAVMSAMQGIPYQMDPSLFEDDSDVIIHNKSKFTLWCEKVWNKIAFWKKHKNNNGKDKD